MFEDVTGEHRVSKEELHAAEPGLRVDLLNAQFDLRQAGHAVLVLLEGDRPSCDEVVDLMGEWLDARLVDTRVFLEPSQEERERPPAWRYWNALPAHGRIGVFFGGYVLSAIARRVRGDTGKRRFHDALERIARFEKCLVDDGMRLRKFWFQLPKKELKKRLKKADHDPNDEIYVDERDWRVYRRYDEILPVAERALERTHTAEAPWTVIDATDRDHRNLTVMRALLATMRAGPEPPPETPATPDVTAPAPDVLGAVNLGASLDYSEYRKRLEAGQARLHALTRKAREKGRSSVLVFEGWDAAGKGGCIRRLTRAVAARDHQVVSIAAPTEEERRQHYLWRFWRRLPRAGRLAIFDRSWYGRVLVERVEGFAAEHEWRRAYDEINAFEKELSDHGMPLLKFWLHVDPDEQLRRFEARARTPYKKYKLTDEDYRNRDKWNAYVDAVNEMVGRTSTDEAPWYLVPADDKRFARVFVLETVCWALEKALV